MSIFLAYFSKNYWKFTFNIWKMLSSIVNIFGWLWLIVEITSFFWGSLSDFIKAKSVFFIAIGILIAIWHNRPILAVCQRLKNRDVDIEICIGDFFKFPGAFIIGSNTTFDTDIKNGLINPKSIQGQFTKKFYSNIDHLNADLDNSLKDEASYDLTFNKLGKKKVFDFGTVAKINIKNTNAYFVAIASLNEHGNAESSLENLQNSLAKLWFYIGNRGVLEPIVIPVLGSGFSRLTETREEIIKEIIKSFVAACVTKRFTEKLSIIIHPSDYKKNDMDLNELDEFLKYECKYVQFKSNNDIGGGIAIAHYFTNKITK